LVAHRGGAKLAPENTRVAFEQARDLWGAHQLELDVHLSRDGVPMVSHDASVDRTTNGQGWLRDLLAAELSQLDAGWTFTTDNGGTFPYRGQGIGIPSLQEVLTAMPDMPVMIDVKENDAAAPLAVLATIRAAGATHRVCIGSENDRTAARLVEEAPEMAHFFPESAARAFCAAVATGGPIPEVPFDVLAVPFFEGGYEIPTPAFLAAAHAHGWPVQVWTVDDPEPMRLLIQRGVDGIQTDRPDLLRSLLTKRPG
jgi:glycerophosphoryl diester phosphodiesterase